MWLVTIDLMPFIVGLGFIGLWGLGTAAVVLFQGGR